MLAAWRAGIHAAAMVMALTTKQAVMKAMGSMALTWNSSDLRKLVRPRAMPRATGTPMRKTCGEQGEQFAKDHPEERGCLRAEGHADADLAGAAKLASFGTRNLSRTW
jgi:hypothetical protein